MANTATIQIRIDPKTKREAAKVLSGIGIDISSGMKMFLHQVVLEQSLPFRPGRTVNGYTPEYEEELLKEEAWALKHGKQHTTVNSALEELWGSKK